MTVEEWVEAYRRAWEERDPDAAAALFTEDAGYRSNIFEVPHEGRSGIRNYWTTVTADQEDVEVQMGRPFVDGNRVAVEWWTVMRSGGQLVTLTGCLLLEMAEGGLCRWLREYWNVAEGRFTPPAGWGT